MTTKQLKKQGFEFWDQTLEEAKYMGLTNIGTEYNECGGYITADTPEGDNVIVMFHSDPDSIYDIEQSIKSELSI